MPDVSRRTITVSLPVDRPDLRTAFEVLASRDGFIQRFIGRDAETGEQVVIEFAETSQPESSGVPFQ